MIWKAVILLGLALGSQAVIVAHSEQKLKQGFHSEHTELSHIGSHKPEHHEEYAWAYPSYEFSYSVNDPHTHDHKGQHEKRHGDEVIGEYWLLQPDGKKRTVKYQADKHKGFTAHVHYMDHHHHEKPQNEKPHREEIIIPVEEIVLEHEPEVPKHIVEEVQEEMREAEEEDQPEEQPEEQLEEQLKEVNEEKHKEKHIEHKPRGPIHIEYYIQHKYKKHHDVHEKKQELKDEKHEEHHERVQHHIPIAPLEIYSKIHHPIRNEHHDHVELKEHHSREEYKGHEERKPVHHHHVELKEHRSREEHKGHEERKPVHHRHVEHKEHRSHDVLKAPEKQHGHEEHKPVHHQIRYRPLINYNHEHHHHKSPEHKSPLLRLTLIDNEEKERPSEDLSPIRVSEVQAERKHHVEHPPHIPLLRLHKPIVHHQRKPVTHHQDYPHYQEYHGRHYRSHGKQQDNKH